MDMTYNANGQLKDDLYKVLEKHSTDIDKAMKILDEMLHETHNGTDQKIMYTGSPINYHTVRHYTKGNSE